MRRLWMDCFARDPNNRLLSRSSSHVHHVKRDLNHEDVNKPIKLHQRQRRRCWARLNYNNNTPNDHEIFSLILCWLMLFFMFYVVVVRGAEQRCVAQFSSLPKNKNNHFYVCLLIVLRALFSSRPFKILEHNANKNMRIISTLRALKINWFNLNCGLR